MLVNPVMRFSKWTGVVLGFAFIGGLVGCKRKKATVLMFAVVLVSLLPMSSCGGGSGGSGGGPRTDPGTPAGTYTLTITATSGTTTHNMAKTVVVQ
jgi:hypothetical protein